MSYKNLKYQISKDPGAYPLENLQNINPTPEGFISLDNFKWWRPPKGWIVLDVKPNWRSERIGDENPKALFPCFGAEKEIIYRPHLENETLFLKLLNFKQTPKNIESFLSRWGPISWREHGWHFHIKDKEKAEKAGVKVSLGGNLGVHLPKAKTNVEEFFDNLLINTISLWVALKQNDLKTLKTWVKIGGQKNITLKNPRYGPCPWQSQIQFIEYDLKGFNKEYGKFIKKPIIHFSKFDYQDIAKIQLVNCLNSIIGTHHINIKVALNSDLKPHIFIKPDSLLDFIILQFIWAVNENKDFKTCTVCQAWFEVEKDKRKRKKIYCSNKCKQAAFREKQKRQKQP